MSYVSAEPQLVDLQQLARNFPSALIGVPLDAVASLKACVLLYYQVSGEYMQELAQSMTEEVARGQVGPINQESDRSYQDRTEEFEKALYLKLWPAEMALEEARWALDIAGQPMNPAMVPSHRTLPRLQTDRRAVVPAQPVLPRLNTVRQALESLYSATSSNQATLTLDPQHVQNLLQQTYELEQTINTLRLVVSYQLAGYHLEDFASLRSYDVVTLPTTTVSQVLLESDGVVSTDCAICRMDLRPHDEVIKLPD